MSLHPPQVNRITPGGRHVAQGGRGCDIELGAAVCGWICFWHFSHISPGRCGIVGAIERAIRQDMSLNIVVPASHKRESKVQLRQAHSGYTQIIVGLKYIQNKKKYDKPKGKNEINIQHRLTISPRCISPPRRPRHLLRCNRYTRQFLLPNSTDTTLSNSLNLPSSSPSSISHHPWWSFFVYSA